MQVRQVMTNDPVCCTPDTNLRDVAAMMVEYDCGSVPVVENYDNMRAVGVVTDRDITVRTVAAGKNPLECCAQDAMTDTVVSISPEADLMDAIRLMEETKVRRLPVTSANGAVVGMVAQADVIRNVDNEDAGLVVREVSRPTDGPNEVNQDVRHDS
ncbi:CBS domain-containing protein [Deinococcus peraridilitoris]|uniref:Putative signal-transduction protein containing cAMP-binding and CBS domains n=1 Tax=Deinococcus peraridilitoris (strain DSM 19664 / LMG 22246 / CIP 109416 / KR-200) TaxID=937777 RepID=L0A3G5_DEIPD|nr:CBS domain-containing protein [Deinococcus peraridilitoris]AFZ67712.1 putative signal-transduction protein containing cAMP-binding and CBS domains [Deinococcus peraridilitoris DSM 19664]